MKEIKARKTKQAELNKEYRRLLTNLKRRLKRLEKQGIELNFPVPSRPKRITQGSINRLLDLTNRFNYITGRGKVESAKLPASISKIEYRKARLKKYDDDIRAGRTAPIDDFKKGRSGFLKDNQATREKLKEINEGNKDFIDWEHITGGIEIPPDMAGSEIAALYEICDVAFKEAEAGLLFPPSYAENVKRHATHAKIEMNAHNADKLWELFSIYVQAAGYERVAETLTAYVYDSRDHEEWLQEVLDAITTEPKSLNAIQRQQIEKIKEHFSFYFH